MLSTPPTTSSIAQRRQMHRRQQSLDVTTTNSGISKLQQSTGKKAHRRGRSDGSMLLPARVQPIQEQKRHPTMEEFIRMHNERLDWARHKEQIRQQGRNKLSEEQGQQIKQDVQRYLASMPGFSAQRHHNDPQRSNVRFNTTVDSQQSTQFGQQTAFDPQRSNVQFAGDIVAQQVPQANQQTAFEQLQSHMNWYEQTYGASPNRGEPAEVVLQRVFEETTNLDPELMMLKMPTLQPTSTESRPGSRSRPQSQSTMLPNLNTTWPSPPSSEPNGSQTQQVPIVLGQTGRMLARDFIAAMKGEPMAADMLEYTAAINRASVTDALPQQMPTLYEDIADPMLADQTHHNGLSSNAIADFNDPNFDFGIQITAVSPPQALLNQLGTDMPASIVETGVAPQEVQQYIGAFSTKDKKYPCLYPDCNKKFGRKENVRAHVQTHLGDRQFQCDLCEKTFVRHHDLKRHIAIHSDDRPHACMCGQSFARHDALTRHRQRGMCIGALPGYEKDPANLPKRGRPRKIRPDNEARTEKASKQRRLNKTKSADKSPRPVNTYAASSYSASDRDYPMTPPDTSDPFDADAYLSVAHGEPQYAQFVDSGMSWKNTPPSSPLMSSPNKAMSELRRAVQQQLTLKAENNGISPAMLNTTCSPFVLDTPTKGGHQQKSTPLDLLNMPFDYGKQSFGTGAFDECSSPPEFDIFNNVFDGIAVQPDAVQDGFSPSMESHASSSLYNYSDYDNSVLKNKMVSDNDAMDVFAPNNIFNELGPELAESHDMADMLNSWLSHN